MPLAEIRRLGRCGKSRSAVKLRVSFKFVKFERSIRSPSGDVEV